MTSLFQSSLNSNSVWQGERLELEAIPSRRLTKESEENSEQKVAKNTKGRNRNRLDLVSCGYLVFALPIVLDLVLGLAGRELRARSYPKSTPDKRKRRKF